jgi:Putative prokaryotic signal transducing protein
MSWFRRSPAAPPDDDALVDLATVPLWLSEILRTALQDEGIEARTNPSFDVVIDGLTNSRVWVPRRDLARAQQVLASLQNGRR